jgi:hypothetical protein
VGTGGGLVGIQIKEEDVDPHRREMLTRSLQAALASASDSHGYGSRERAEWVLEHLRSYLGRLHSALSLPGWTSADVAGGDATGVVTIGVDVLDREMEEGAFSPTLLAYWREFKEGWQACEEAPTLADVELLQRLLHEIAAMMRSA